MNKQLTEISPKWAKIIYSGKSKKILDQVYENISKDLTTITPPIENWFEWAKLTDVDNIKCVILGQDPYPRTGWAHGLSFSCMSCVPPSLKNIYKCLEKQKNITQLPESGNLTSWVKQGVLLLNVGLTTNVGITAAHIKFWKPYITQIIKNLCEYYYNKGQQLVFMLWGNFAKGFIKYIDSDFHVVMNWIHPSPLAQNRVPAQHKFINCSHFSDINEFLTADCRAPINWNSVNEVLESETTELSNTAENQQIETPDRNKKTYESVDEIFNINPLKHIAFTDGSAHPNNKSEKSLAGYASVFISGPFKDKRVYGNMSTDNFYASNIRAEGYAIIRTLEMVNECKKKWTECAIVTDCEFWINMVEKYMPKWKSQMFTEKANSDLTLRLWRTWNQVSRKGSVSLLHMRSHNKNGWKNYDSGTYQRFCYEQNDYADKLCNYARINLEKGKETISSVEYET